MYFPAARQFDIAHLSLTRGCVSDCRFCGSPDFWKRRVRSHSADYFVEQLTALRQRGAGFSSSATTPSR